MDKLKELEVKSDRNFGRLTSYGNFIMDHSRVPTYEVPNLDGFDVF